MKDVLIIISHYSARDMVALNILLKKYQILLVIFWSLLMTILQLVKALVS
jgi:hypothetical protein